MRTCTWTISCGCVVSVTPDRTSAPLFGGVNIPIWSYCPPSHLCFHTWLDFVLKLIAPILYVHTTFSLSSHKLRIDNTFIYSFKAYINGNLHCALFLCSFLELFCFLILYLLIIIVLTIYFDELVVSHMYFKYFFSLYSLFFTLLIVTFRKHIQF